MSSRTSGVPEALRAAGVTRRETDVLWLVADRFRNREIAAKLFVSERTVESHVSSLLAKLDAPDRQTLIDLGTRLRDRTGNAAALPRPLSSFVGRTAEIGQVAQLLGVHRLVTLIGPAGTGKTRLALEVSTAADSLPPPVLVDLAVLPPGSDVDRHFAAALGVSAEESRVRDALRELLAERRSWLIVDNCEHVAARTAELLADLLSVAGQLRVLATSHGPLGIGGEVVYEVLPLPIPVPEGDEPATVLAAAAGQLFAERAAMAAPGFLVTVENARDVAALCRRLDGLPLSIELAAARMRAFSPREVLGHLDERFDLLTSAGTTSGARHPSLEAALRWSYQLLDAEEQLLLERCAVFPSAFDYDTAATVLGYAPLTQADLVRVFPRLLDRSLISVIHRGSTTGYRMLESVREFASAQLAARGELERARSEHARRHLEHAASLADTLQGREQMAALRWFDSHWDDLRVAMDWALARAEAELAWRFLAGIGMRWDTLGLRGELFDWLDILLEQPLPPDALGVRAAATAALVLWYQDLDRAAKLAESARELAKGEDDWHRALAALVTGRIAAGTRRADAAITYLRAAASDFQRLGDTWHHAAALALLSDSVPDPASALATLQEASDLFGQVGDRVLLANCLNQMAQQCIALHYQLDAAEEWLTEARKLAEQTGNQHELLHALLFQAQIDQRRGDDASTAGQFDRLLREFRRMGDSRCVSRCLIGLGSAELASRDLRAARQHLVEAIEMAERAGNFPSLATALQLMARIEHQAGRYQDAARLVGAADAAAERAALQWSGPLSWDDDVREALKSELPHRTFNSLLADGREMPISRLLTSVTSRSGSGVRGRGSS